MLDWLIKNGTVVDGSGRAPFCADIGIKAGLIVSIGAIKESAKETMDATGLWITPGFIDLHTTIAHDQSGHTMVDAGGETFIPRGLTIVVGVKVYKAGGDPQARGVHGFFGWLIDCSNTDNEACLDADVCTEGCTA